MDTDIAQYYSEINCATQQEIIRTTNSPGHWQGIVKRQKKKQGSHGSGKPGKWLKKNTCMEKSWNLKNDEISWKKHGIWF